MCRPIISFVGNAERTGRLAPGGRVVECTGGSTGVSLALVCAARGYPLSIVTVMCDSGLKYVSTPLYGPVRP